MAYGQNNFVSSISGQQASSQAGASGYLLGRVAHVVYGPFYPGTDVPDPNYNDPTLSGIPLGMQKNKNYFDPNLTKIDYEPKKLNFYTKEDEDEAIDKRNIKYGWTNPDKLNLLNSFINLAGVRESTPFEPTVKFQRPETRYADPARALAANTEQYNAARQASAMFAGPQSRYSLNAGQYGKNAADIIGQYANQNIQIVVHYFLQL